MALDMTGTACKYCGLTNVVKYGKLEGVQLYWCKDCRRKFRANDHLFAMKTPINQVSSALSMYYEGASINGIRRHLLQEYGNYPSSNTVFDWINRFTDEAIDCFEKYSPENIGDLWVADETVLRIDGANVWMYDIIDVKTRFLLASRVTTARTTEDAKKLMEAAARRAGKTPQVVVTDRNNSYLDGIERAYGANTEHRQGGPFKVDKGENTNLIERFHGTLKARTKVMRGLKSMDSAIQFTDGFLAYYNYLRPHEKLDGHTPAEVAQVACPLKTWVDVARNSKPKVEVLTTPSKVVVISEQKPLVRPLTRRRYRVNRPRLRKRKPAVEARTTLQGVRLRKG